MRKPAGHIGLSAIALSLLLQGGLASAAVTFIGEGSIPGNATDQSGLTGMLEDGITPHNLAGGFGSAMAYTGRDNLYVATPDRGPADGATSYIDRIYTLRIDVVRQGGAYEVKPQIVSTRLLRKESQKYFTGSASAFDATGSTESLRFDPEGVRVSRCGHTAFVSDEYGPYVYEFDLHGGKRLRALNMPNKFLIDAPSATPSAELANNVVGRQSNRGMEGLAISPDGGKLYGVMQSALIQDGALDAANKRIGLNNRIIEIDTATGAVREFLYQMDKKSNGISEIVAVNDHEFLVLERDGNGGEAAAFKKIFKIDIAAATDIRGVKALPSSGAPAGVVPASKALFMDLLDPAHGLKGQNFPEKIEALAFGPDLPDGRHLLLVANDNDFNSAQATRIMAFAIDSYDLPGFQPQDIAQRHSHECLGHHEDD